VDVIGNLTMDVVYAPKKFVDANPKMAEAMLAALDAANEFIRTRRADAAEIFARTSKTKVSKEEILKILEDPDTQFSTTPSKIMNFVEFMHRAGRIKVAPAKWSDMFIPQLAGRSGS
jgi:NitT/TauT family transport system substrate-binding protein